MLTIVCMLKVYIAESYYCSIVCLHVVLKCIVYMPNDTVVYCDILYPRSAPVVCLMTLRVQKCV